MKCFNCSVEISEGMRFCPRCGANLGFSKELIDRARNNDQAAVTELYNKTYSSVYYTITALIKDEDAALDILQDSYIKAFKSLDQLKEPEKFKAWVKQIAHNRSIDWLRKTKPVLFIDMESTDSDMPLEFEDANTDNLPEAVIDRKETSRLIREILNDLPDEQRAVISMYYYEQLSVREIADQLGVSENTVKSRLNYGRKKIETKVLDLEKKGTKLYGLAPIPFLLLLFRSQDKHEAKISPKISKKIVGSCMSPDAVTGTANAVGTAGVKSAVGGIVESVLAKVLVGVLVAGIAVGGITVAVNSIEKNADTKPESVTGYGRMSPDVENAVDRQTELSSEPSDRTATAKPSPPLTELPTERTPDTLYRFSGTYTDPRGIITVELPDVWGEFGKIAVSSGYDTLTRQNTYTVDFQFNNVYNGQEAEGSCIKLVVYEDPAYEPQNPTAMQTVVARSESYTIVRQASNGRGVYFVDGNSRYAADGTEEYNAAQADFGTLGATVDAVLSSLEIHDPPLYGTD